MARSEQQIIRDLQDEMVLRAELLVQELKLKKGEGAKSGKTQASKALEVAQSAGSLSVFINWLRYQAGREKGGNQGHKSAEFWTKTIATKKKNEKERYLAKEMSDNLVWLRNQVFSEVKKMIIRQQKEAEEKAQAQTSKKVETEPLAKEKETLAQKQARVTMRAVIRFLGYFRRALIGADFLDQITLNKEAK